MTLATNTYWILLGWSNKVTSSQLAVTSQPTLADVLWVIISPAASFRSLLLTGCGCVDLLRSQLLAHRSSFTTTASISCSCGTKMCTARNLAHCENNSRQRQGAALDARVTRRSIWLHSRLRSPRRTGDAVGERRSHAVPADCSRSWA